MSGFSPILEELIAQRINSATSNGKEEVRQSLIELRDAIRAHKVDQSIVGSIRLPASVTAFSSFSDAMPKDSRVKQEGEFLVARI